MGDRKWGRDQILMGEKALVLSEHGGDPNETTRIKGSK